MQYICIYFDSKTYFLLKGRIATSRQIILLVGGIEIEQIHRRGDRNRKNSMRNRVRLSVWVRCRKYYDWQTCWGLRHETYVIGLHVISPPRLWLCLTIFFFSVMSVGIINKSWITAKPVSQCCI